MELINAKKARDITNKVNSEYIESILQKSIEEAVIKGYFYCYITFGDTYAAVDAMTILKEKGYKYYRVTEDQLCYKIEW
jgi:hypothetical protein